MIKLHLGCGQTYFEGYVNIDFPSEEHTIQKSVVADKYENIIELDYPDNSVEEIRLHHVFEHFPRPTALALICRWRDFLRPGGLLRIETPDVMECFKIMTSHQFPFDHKQQVMRHIFGSHEAKWAFHADGWYEEKFEYVLKKFGFNDLHFETNRYGLLRNIEVFAYKTQKGFTATDYFNSTHEILIMSTVKADPERMKSPVGSELKMLELWKKEWQEVYMPEKGNSQGTHA